MWAQRRLGGALDRLVAKQLIGADVQGAGEIREQVRRRVVALGFIIGDAAAGDAELIGELLLSEASGVA